MIVILNIAFICNLAVKSIRGPPLKRIIEVGILCLHRTVHVSGNIFAVLTIFRLVMYLVNRDLRSTYISSLTSQNIKQWFLKEGTDSEKHVGRGSYGDVYRVKILADNKVSFFAKKVTRGKTNYLCDDFVREFGILEKLTRSVKPTERLIKLIGVELSRSVDGL